MRPLTKYKEATQKRLKIVLGKLQFLTPVVSNSSSDFETGSTPEYFAPPPMPPTDDSVVTSASIAQIATQVQELLKVAQATATTDAQQGSLDAIYTDFGMKDKDDWPAYGSYMDALGKLVDATVALVEPAQSVSVSTEDERDGFEISVSVTRKKEVFGEENPLPMEVKDYRKKFTIKKPKPAPSQQGAPAFILDFVRDNSFVVDSGSIARKGHVDNPGLSLGYLQHFRISGPAYLTFGAAASELKSLSYLAGVSLRVGSRDRSGFITIGLIVSQKTGLDGVQVGDAWTEGQVPTKKVYKSGIAIAFSVGIG